MKWKKRGLVYAPRGDRWWTKHRYAFNPTAEVGSDDTLRIYFASLDEHNRGRVGYVDLDAADPCQIKYEAAEPTLEIGPPGAFDDSGVNPSCLVSVGDHRYLYYIGWQRCERVPYMLFSGLAIADRENNGFARHARVPVLDRIDNEPFSRSAPCVLTQRGSFRAWYWSCESWTEEPGWIHYNNVIRHAVSDDGFNWRATRHVCIAPDGPNDYAVGRPWVIHEGEQYRMWYSIRSRTAPPYRIGYAESTDGLSWKRKDAEVGIGPSESGWDSEMICHPCVVDVPGRRYLFYNGNRHGLEGFGVAELERD